ncbi:MAG: hypothetical protein SGBAC_010850 [Bacillariaceae sp.]
MPAISPYAPPRRNSFLRQSSSSLAQVESHSLQGKTVIVSLFIFALKFWTNNDRRRRLLEIIRKQPILEGFICWIQKSVAVNKRGKVPESGPAKSTPSVEGDASNFSLQRVRDNQATIRRVLNYWFGSGTPDENQKKLWMIASSSHKLRLEVDREITEEFEALLVELAEGDNSDRWKEWCLDKDGIYGMHGTIAAIVVLDQFSRHIQRNHETHKTQPKHSYEKSLLDCLALKTAQLFVDTHKDEIRCGMVPLPMHIFSLMPFRHASTIETLEYVRHSIEQNASMHEQMGAMLGRFRKATNRRLALLQDEARRTGKLNPSAASASGTYFNDEAILETFAFETSMEPAKKHPIHKTIAAFLTGQGIHATDSGPQIAVIVSLSGGVDSMVIASVLSHMKKSCNYNLKVVAVHIDYGNRPEASAEADFVRRYCESIDIEFTCRAIDEVTRGVTSRDDYERISRDIRYTSYREAITKARSEMNEDEMKVGVMLGHHRGDLRENVLSNAHKGSGPLDLSGMTAVSQNDGVTLFRPLLPLEKSFVLDYAHTFGVPYFKDTTPHWSTRGKLRNKLIPLLQEIYGEGSMNNLSNLATESDECRALLHGPIMAPFLKSVAHKPMGIMFNTAQWKEKGFFFWKFVLREALHRAKFGMFTDKSVGSFLGRVKASVVKEGWLQCRKDYGVYLQKDGRVFVFRPSSFPWNKRAIFNVDGQGKACNKVLEYL